MLESLVFSCEPPVTVTSSEHPRRTWSKRSAATLAALALTLTACTTTPEPQIIIKEVKVPIPVPCPIDTSEPVYVADKQSLIEAAKRGADAAVALLLGEIGQRKAWAEGVKRQAGECK